MTYKLNKNLIVIAGPTAVGKTMITIKLAKYFDTSVINADSRQVYREMSIGTAKPSIGEMAGVKHYFVGSKSLNNLFNAGIFEKEALAICDEVFSKKDLLILSGGSGLYINALCEGLDEFPEVESVIRKDLNEEFEASGLEPLLEELRIHDPEYYRIVDLQNPKRVIRALEVIRASGKPYSFFRKRVRRERSFGLVKIGLHRNKPDLYDRINQRMDRMIEGGLFAEVKSLIAFRNHNTLQTVGYQEIFNHLDGKYDYDEAVRLMKQNSRRYAKRQITWFRRDPEYRWFHPELFEEIVAYITSKVQE